MSGSGFGQSSSPFGGVPDIVEPTGSGKRRALIDASSDQSSSSPCKKVYIPKPFGVGCFDDAPKGQSSSPAFGAPFTEPVQKSAFGSASTPAFGNGFAGFSASGEGPAHGWSGKAEQSSFGINFQQPQPAFGGSNAFGSSSPFGASNEPPSGSTSSWKSPSSGPWHGNNAASSGLQSSAFENFGSSSGNSFGCGFGQTSSSSEKVYVPKPFGVSWFPDAKIGQSSTPLGSMAAFGTPHAEPSQNSAFGSASTPAFANGLAGFGGNFQQPQPAFGGSNAFGFSHFGASNEPPSGSIGSWNTPSSGPWHGNNAASTSPQSSASLKQPQGSFMSFLLPRGSIISIPALGQSPGSFISNELPPGSVISFPAPEQPAALNNFRTTPNNFGLFHSCVADHNAVAQPMPAMNMNPYGILPPPPQLSVLFHSDPDQRTQQHSVHDYRSGGAKEGSFRRK